MKLPKKKYLFTLLFLGLACPFLLYFYVRFSHHVEILKTHYPQIVLRAPNEVRVKFDKKKPRYWVNLMEMSSYAKWAIILSEDWSFYQHKGVDLNQVEVALRDMVEQKRFRGASTISQQLVKNIFLSEYPTLWRKLHEYILTPELERILTKSKILEIYLNSIEFGPGIYGLKAASKHYFKKPPAQLSPRESAFLAMLLPSPKRYYVSFKRRKLTSFARKRIASVLEKLRMGKVISKERYEAELRATFDWELH